MEVIAWYDVRLWSTCRLCQRWDRTTLSSRFKTAPAIQRRSRTTLTKQGQECSRNRKAWLVATSTGTVRTTHIAITGELLCNTRSKCRIKCVYYACCTYMQPRSSLRHVTEEARQPIAGGVLHVRKNSQEKKMRRSLESVAAAASTTVYGVTEQRLPQLDRGGVTGEYNVCTYVRCNLLHTYVATEWHQA